MKVLRGLATLIMIGSIGLCSVSQAAVIYDNLTENLDQNVLMNSNGGANWSLNAEAFLMPSTGNPVLSNVTLTMALAATGSTTGTYSVEIWSNSGANQPNIKLFDVATSQTVVGLSGNPTQKVYTPTSTITLTNGTNYWLVLNATSYTGSKQIQSLATDSSGGTGVSATTYMNQRDAQNLWGTNFGTSHMSMKITTVPEPSTYALAALGSGTMWVVRRRRQSR
jgi:hypothetical protein